MAASPRAIFAAGFLAGISAAGAAWLGASARQAALAPTPSRVRVVPTFEAARPEEIAQALGAPEAAALAKAPDPTPVRVAVDGKPSLPRFEKLVAKPLSSEPHQVLAAWDEDEASSTPGERRAFVLAVSPSLSDDALAALARDVRAGNRDARLLDVRIYDDADAATGPRIADSGHNARAHLVAEVQRNEAAGLDLIRVRGKSLDP